MSCQYTSQAISLNDFTRICRTCLKDQKVGPIFEMIVGDLKAIDLLEYCVTIQVNKNDSLPQNICETCLNDLYRFYEFKKQCHDNETVLKLLLEETSSVSELSKEKTDKEESELYDIRLIEDEGEYKCESLSDSDTQQQTTLKENAFEDSDKKTFETSQFQCRDCKESFRSRDELRMHRKKAKHPEHRNHQCQVCKKLFTSSKLRQHMRSHTKEKPYQCDICHQCFSLSGNLKRHKMTHTGERPHVCSICGKGFIQATSLHAHEKVHRKYASKSTDGSLKFTCNFCGRSFKRLAPFNAHLERHTTHKKIERKPEKVEEAREHVCEICNRAYRTKHLLKAHTLTHGEKSFLCSDCGKGFVTKAALQSHLRVHTGEKPHTCVICKKSFAHVGSFDSHMLIHSGQKPYSCSFCPKSFTQLSHLTYHLRTHSGERPYSCSYCGKSFALKGNLTVHVRTHTGETPYLCPVCGKGFYDSSSMKKHKRNHKEENVALQEPQPHYEAMQQQHYQVPMMQLSCS